MLSLLRIIRFAFQDIGRNIGLSFMTVLILVLMLLSVNTLLIVNLLTNRSISSIKNQINVSIYFTPDATDKNIDEIKKFVKSFPEVTEMIFKNRDEVLAEFKQTHADNPEVLASVEELNENPLGATMVVKTREPGDYAKIIKALNVPEYENLIEAKSFGDTETAIERVKNVTTQVERFVAVLSAVFIIIAFLIIFNTIRASIYTQRTEISIKKLVGASNWFVRGPYIVESLFFSALSVVIAYSLVLLFSGIVDPYMHVVFSETGILTNYFKSNIIVFAGLQFAAVFALTIVSSALAMRKHLRA